MTILNMLLLLFRLEFLLIFTNNKVVVSSAYILHFVRFCIPFSGALIFQRIVFREVDVIGIFRYKNTWPLCLEFLRSGKIDVKPLITHRFGFSQKEVEEAFETSARGGDAIKVMFNL